MSQGLLLTFIYLKVFLLFFALFTSGILILRRATDETRLQVILPSGAIFGVALYIFLVNLTAHFVKGPPGFYISLLVEILAAIFVSKKLPTKPIKIPKGILLLGFIASLLLWSTFLYQITSHGKTDGADSTIHYSLASVFARGDYPIRAPWQPDYVAYHHIGTAEFLGAARTITGAPFYLLHPLLAFLVLLAISQILTWIIKVENLKTPLSLVLLSLPALVGLISLGGFMLAWPVNLGLSQIQTGFFDWLKGLPTLNNSYEVFGSPTTLDGLTLFIHRLLATSFFLGILTVVVSPNREYRFLSSFVVLVVLAAIALTDEAVLLVALPATFLVILFTLFKKSVIRWILFSAIALAVIGVQGGIVTEVVLDRYGTGPGVLVFPEDGQGKFENYRSYRAKQQSSKLFPKQNYLPLRFLHPGIIWQLGALFLISFFYIRKKGEDSKFILWILTSSAAAALIAYHVIVPQGIHHTNGNRFLSLSYYLSGIGISVFVARWWLNSKTGKKLLKILLAWVFIVSIVPPLASLFPRPKVFWFSIQPSAEKPQWNWIRQNIPLDKRILVLTDVNPIPAPNIELVREMGALTPVWGPTPRAYDSFDMSPIYADVYYTLNPSLLKVLKANYLIISNRYVENLTAQRKADLSNPEYFEVAYERPGSTDAQFEKVLRVKEEYLSEGKNLDGTLTQLYEVTPKTGSFYIDYPPNITENMYRALRLLLHDREIYYNPAGSFYNSRIDVEVKYYGEGLDSYDYLILGESVDPKSICRCETSLIWSGLGNGLKLWKTN